MKKSKYDIEIIKQIAKHQKTVSEVASLYGVSNNAIIQVLKKYKLKSHSRRVIIITSDKTIKCDTVKDAAYIIGVCVKTLQTTLKGKKSRVLSELNIEVNYYDEID